MKYYSTVCMMSVSRRVHRESTYAGRWETDAASGQTTQCGCGTLHGYDFGNRFPLRKRKGPEKGTDIFFACTLPLLSHLIRHPSQYQVRYQFSQFHPVFDITPLGFQYITRIPESRCEWRQRLSASLSSSKSEFISMHGPISGNSRCVF